MADGRKDGVITDINNQDMRTFILETGPLRNRYVNLASSLLGVGSAVTFVDSGNIDGLTGLPIATGVAPA